MNTIEWISLLSSIGALLTAIIAACTLFELYRQRKSSYKPDLSVLQNDFQLRPSKISDVELAMEWGKHNEEESNLVYFAGLTVVNVGFGAAKNVTAKWIFERDKFLDEVNDLAQKTHQSFYIEKTEHMLSINKKGSGQFMVNASPRSEEFEYLLPLSQDNTGREVSLPPSYALLVSAYLSLKAYNEMKFYDLKIPNITLELSYSDIGKGAHKTKHKIECEVTSITTREGKLPSEFGVRLQEIS
ncbi:hypothetical protein [Pelagibaculum spongiae]|uniref:Uncharacterized protein n=1 Tax=Pelagibaculum spongiae TaxID=2080658 RepID=A0A2V1H5A1_9GAMM|nr:hypothetical protein [Pelagibaculum spongiae]PVZ71945.1 hypothetical protein DC094_02675 [Pelagibaculum spongiae]